MPTVTAEGQDLGAGAERGAFGGFIARINRQSFIPSRLIEDFRSKHEEERGNPLNNQTSS